MVNERNIFVIGLIDGAFTGGHRGGGRWGEGGFWAFCKYIWSAWNLSTFNTMQQTMNFKIKLPIMVAVDWFYQTKIMQQQATVTACLGFKTSITLQKIVNYCISAQSIHFLFSLSTSKAQVVHESCWECSERLSHHTLQLRTNSSICSWWKFQAISCSARVVKKLPNSKIPGVAKHLSYFSGLFKCKSSR